MITLLVIQYKSFYFRSCISSLWWKLDWTSRFYCFRL